MLFNELQIDFMKKIGISIASFENLNDSDFVLIEEKVSDHLLKFGFDANYEPTKEGIMCESILDIL